jgi:hypothetical protein
MCADAPDTSKQQQAAADMASLSKEQLDWAKEIYAQTAPQREASQVRAAAISDEQLAQMKKQGAITDDYAAYQKNTFRPLETGLVADAQAYDTPAQRDAKAAEAEAGVGLQVQAAQQAQTRNMARMGINPNSGRAVEMDKQLALASATAQAGAGQKARDAVETQGYARRMDAASLGRGLPSAQATSAQISTQQGNSSVANMAAVNGITAQGAGIMQSGFGGAQTSLAGAGGIYGNIAQQQASANAGNGQLLGALGTVVGGIYGGPWGAAAGGAAGRAIGGGSV